ncbi:hypothetical protein L211DRAFT_242312 [Terfezia boudieri ATCC MYA-4762]|uniref:Uncharacterized protein n=1 Tax=Terfezia boudieri ATCC MYA-4762 TaxID=1051890 RepID=A0A3N4M4P3_9PEZI|nr:hypothetical protein L211DRAFT_242312 [Terfezia boudieri ATCC MYA-4762]
MAPSGSITTTTSTANPHPRRLITLYDAASARATFQGLLPLPRPSPTNQPQPYHHPAHGPDEILGRRHPAPLQPIPYEDTHNLPSSDLLKAIHQYTSEFYQRHGLTRGAARAMDETGLLVVGVLIEEAVKVCLGAGVGGAGAFVEEDGEEEGGAKRKKRGKGVERTGESDSDSRESTSRSQSHSRKRRRRRAAGAAAGADASTEGESKRISRRRKSRTRRSRGGGEKMQT